jgi:hypothetical protein
VLRKSRCCESHGAAKFTVAAKFTALQKARHCKRGVLERCGFVNAEFEGVAEALAEVPFEPVQPPSVS